MLGGPLLDHLGESLPGFAASPRSSVAAQRERERERRTDPHLTRHPDLSPVQLDELPGEGQSEPGALRLLVGRSHLPELLEHGLLIRWRDPDTAVTDRDLERPTGGSRPDVDPAALGR